MSKNCNADKHMLLNYSWKLRGIALCTKSVEINFSYFFRVGATPYSMYSIQPGQNDQVDIANQEIPNPLQPAGDPTICFLLLIGCTGETRHLIEQPLS